VFALDVAACYNFNSDRNLPFVEFLHSLVRHRWVRRWSFGEALL
jgi:hypothetical protein